VLDVAYIGGGQGKMAAERGQRERPESILIVSLDNLGDLVFASGLLPPLREHFPTSRIAMWCKEYSSGLVSLMPDVDETYTSDPFWDRAPGAGKGSLRGFLSVAVTVRRARFDTAILCFAPWRTAAAVAAMGIPVRIGLERRRNRRWLTEILPAEDRRRPVLDEVARLLQPLGIQAAPLRYHLDASHLTSELSAVAKSIGSEPYAALHPFAGSENRCVKLDEWVRVGSELSSLGMSILWIGAVQELDRLRRRRDTQGYWRYSDVLFGGSLTMVSVAISRAQVFLGHDSGPMHIAAALGVPTVGVFAPGEPQRTFPQGTGPWRIISRPSPLEITWREILAEARALLTPT
jgi:ADP-heptose:LPS heptosyltransferase